MNRIVLFTGGALLALTSSLAMAQPEDLLPDIFNDPAPAPTPTPRPQQPRPQPQQTVAPASQGAAQGGGAPTQGSSSVPVVQDIPASPAAPGEAYIALPDDFPSLAELEEMEESEVNELLGLRPRFDIPPAARRAMKRIGVIAGDEGGFPSRALAGQPAALVRAALEGTRAPMVSRWGHILLRRALASRLDAPAGMDPAEFAALRASVLNVIGESGVARALVQDVDGGNYSPALTGAAFDAYLATGDILGMCPVARLQPTHAEDGNWIMMQAICDAYSGEARSAERRLQRALGRGEAPEIDVRLAQRFAGAAADAGRAVTIEWNGVEELTPWRFALSRALGVELPDSLRNGASWRYDAADATMPAVALAQRVQAADIAAAHGILSSGAMVDLYSQLYASDAATADERQAAANLRQAYVADTPSARLAAMRSTWGENGGYGRLVLTSYAAARLPAGEDGVDDAARLIASMLAAGLDRNAMRWAGLVEEGSQGWALLALANPADAAVAEGSVRSFMEDDASDDDRKSRFLIAGLAGLGRIDGETARELAGDLGMDLGRQTAWSERISAAGRVRNPALVAILAGLGMQGDGWNRMTGRHLYHIVSALKAAGLEAEARMIAAEAVARA